MATEMTDAVKRKSPEPEAAARPAAGEPAPEKEEAAAAERPEKPARTEGDAQPAATAGESATTAGEKRKAPEPPSTGEAATKAAAAVATAPAASADEPDAKRLRPTRPDPAVVRKQIEYYLSDENLRYDKFFHEKISASPEGWLDMGLVLSCNKMKAMRATLEDVLTALKGSRIEVSDGNASIRRPANAALPTLEFKAQHPKKSSVHAHDGGVVAVIKGIPEEQSWVQVKERLRQKLPDKVPIWFVSEVSDKNQCIIVCAPFEGDMQFYEELEIEIGGAKLRSEVCMGDLLQQSLKIVPRHVRDKREKEAKKRQKERNKPIVVGALKFVNVAALRGRVKEILNSRSDGEQLKVDGTDFKLIRALLDYHPKGAEKSSGLVGIKVQRSIQGETRCFFMVKADGQEEDFSAKKCLDALEANPPYVESDPKAAKGKAATPVSEAAPAPAEAASATAEAAAAPTPAAEPAVAPSPAAEPAAKPTAEPAPPAEEAKKEEGA